MTTVVDQPGGGDVVEIFEPPPSRRPFSPGDVLRLLVSIVLIVLGAILASAAQATIKGLEEDLVDAFGRLPDTFESAVLSIAQLGTSLIPLITLVVLLVRGRWKVALVLVLTGVLAFVAMTVADVFVIDRDLEDVLARLREEDSITAASFPNSHVLATTTAVVTVAAPWLTRRWKQRAVVERRVAGGPPSAGHRAPGLRPRARCRHRSRSRFARAVGVRQADHRAEPAGAARCSAVARPPPATNRAAA